MEKNSQEWEKVKKDFKDWYFDNNEIFELTKNMYQSLITSLLFDKEEFTNPQIEGRIKDRNECIFKFESKYLEKYTDEVSLENIKSEIKDLIGIRVICSYEDEISKISNIISENFTILKNENKSEERIRENTFGYKGLHLDIKLSKDRESLDEYTKIKDFQVELQIRTVIQHAWSSLDHKIIYKKEEHPELLRSVARLAALFEIADSEFIRLRKETENLELKSEEKINKLQENELIEDKEIIDSITFNKFISMKFKYSFYENKAIFFLEEILKYNPNLTLEELSKAYDEQNSIVAQYKETNSRVLSMNPYTTLRHILYASDNEMYSRLLTDLQKDNFNEFLNDIKKKQRIKSKS